MKYQIVNIAILKKKDLPKSFNRKGVFYKYLLDNNVAYYYSSIISEHKTIYDKKILSAGVKFTQRYIKTLKLLHEISSRNTIPFILFKTHRYIEEVVDGDIDIFVKNKDFNSFIQELEKLGFKCAIDTGSKKASCIMDGYCKIEPRTEVSFHNYTVIDEVKIWNHYEVMSIYGIKILKAEADIDISSLLLNVLYGPNYIKLYTFLISEGLDLPSIKKILDPNIYKDLLIIWQCITNTKTNSNFPLFLGNFTYLKWWAERMLSNRAFSATTKLKTIIFFFFIKYKYLIFNKLHFAHEWGII